ncbi:MULTISPECIES: hypothetical protein [unclassified Roseovarius]|uniref:hypothetical protein n=1 Tax=unclassified Roseovarius TaxID=2614913 RepID=UPI00273FF130|nr:MULTISPECIES: hypothetical protein [unclassified Roseovarius]
MTRIGNSLVFAAAFGVSVESTDAQQILVETAPIDPLDVFPLCITKEQTKSFVESNEWSMSQTSDQRWVIDETGVMLRFSDGKLAGVQHEKPSNLEEFTKLAHRKQFFGGARINPEVEFHALPTNGVGQLSMVVAKFYLPDSRRVIYHASKLSDNFILMTGHNSPSECSDD